MTAAAEDRRRASQLPEGDAAAGSADRARDAVSAIRD